MRSLISSSPRGATAPARTNVEWLRAPGERAAFGFAVASNMSIIVGCVVAVLYGASWVESRPLLASHADWMRVVAISAIFVLPASVIGRRVWVRAARGDGVVVRKEQFPELHGLLVRACRKLDIDPVPELVLGRTTTWSAVAYTGWAGRSVVVLDPDLVPETAGGGTEWLAFVMAGALGSIRLGHTRWWVEVLTIYTRRVPWLRAPLLIQWTYSRDRCAAFVVPDGIRGLLVQVLGKDATPRVALAPFVEQTERAPDGWDRVAALTRESPLLRDRARALFEAGFFDRTAERAPRGAPNQEPEPIRSDPP